MAVLRDFAGRCNASDHTACLVEGWVVLQTTDDHFQFTSFAERACEGGERMGCLELARLGASPWPPDERDRQLAAACEDGVCVFNTESCTIFGIEVESGRMLWSHYLGDPLMSAPTIAGGRVFAAYPARPDRQGERTQRPEGMSHALGAFDLHTGELAWSRWLDSDVISADFH